MSNDIIKVKRGNKSQKPSLLMGEPYLAWDSGDLYMGGLNGDHVYSDSVNSPTVSVKSFGAIGDGVNDDQPAIQSALDCLYNLGGGTLFFPLGHYRIVLPLLIKTIKSGGGYDYPFIELKGAGVSGSDIVKDGNSQLYNLDASVIMINGESLSLNDSFSGVKFTDIMIKNNSTNATTYGVYGKTGSRVIASNSSFRVLKDYETIDAHDRYAFYQYSGWAWAFRDCTFHGDYGFYNKTTSTSLLLENCYSSCDKISYHVVGVYITLNNVYGDFSKGVMFYFDFCVVQCSSLGCESIDLTRIIHASNSSVFIETCFFNQPSSDLNEIIYMNASTVRIKNMVVNMVDTVGYLWNGGTSSTLKIDRLKLSGASVKFKYSAMSIMGTNTIVAIVSPDEVRNSRGLVSLLGYLDNNYYDWYVDEPEFPINNIHLGMNDVQTYANETSAAYGNGGTLNGFYLNNDVNARNVLGWSRYAQTSNNFRDGSNYYVPLILSGVSADRPTWQTTGMNYFDTTINKPIWWNGSGWVDANGITV